MTDNTYYKKFFEIATPLNHILISELDKIVSTNSVITFKCYPCETERTSSLKDYFRRFSKTCKECNSWKLNQVPTWTEVLDEAIKEISDLKEDEEWRPILGGWISSYGKAVNSLGKVLVLDQTKDRYSIGGKFQYRKNLIFEAFGNEVHKTDQAITLQKMNEGKTIEEVTRGNIPCVTLKDKNAPISVDNVQLSTFKEVHAEGSKNTRKSERFKEAIKMSFVEKIKVCRYIEISTLPHHVIFEDGNIFNKQMVIGGNRFLAFSTSGGYYVLVVDKKCYYVHRLICMAFLPIEGKSSYEDYKSLECNHKDGNKINNHINNLEWTTHSENMKHAYQTKLNNKVRGILQYELNEDKTQGKFINEYISIAEASRKTDVPEQRIREICYKRKEPIQFFWKFKDETKAEEWSKKFSSKPKAKGKIVMPSIQDA